MRTEKPRMITAKRLKRTEAPPRADGVVLRSPRGDHWLLAINMSGGRPIEFHWRPKPTGAGCEHCRPASRQGRLALMCGNEIIGEYPPKEADDLVRLV